MRAARTAAIAIFLAGACIVTTSPARADPPWTSRRMTLTGGELGVNVGFGLGFANAPQGAVTGSGVYAQIGYGITDRVELLVREGFRFGTFGEYARAEQYGRLYTTDGSVTPGPSIAGNPDLVVLVRFLDRGFVEIGGEIEAGFPVEPGTSFDNTFGVLATFHYAPWLRFDTGVFVNLTYSSPVETTFSVPFALWFQTGDVPLWFGPLTAITENNAGTLTVPLGFGAGYGVTKDIDIRAEWLAPRINASPGTRSMGLGLGVELRH